MWRRLENAQFVVVDGSEVGAFDDVVVAVAVEAFGHLREEIGRTLKIRIVRFFF